MSYASNYPLKTVGQIADVKGGKRLPAGHQFASTSTAFGYIRAQEIGGGSIADPAVFIEQGTYESLRRYRVQAGDVCVTIAGNIGDIGFVKESMEGLTLTENAVRLTAIESVDAQFLAYALQIPEVQIEMKAAAAGAAQPKLGIYKVKAVAVPVPEDFAIQRRIVRTLSSYDNLIATNQRRIALLEDAARRLYREWFVHLRFPGHESVPVNDGVPEGWSRVAIGECFDFHIGGGWGKEFSESGSSETAYVIRGTDIPRIRDGELGSVPLRFHPERNLASRRLEAGDIVFEVSGGSRDQGVGRLLHVTSEILTQFGSPVMCASFCKLIRPKIGLSEFMACTLEYLRVAGALKSFENQSASNIVNFAFTDFCEGQLALVPSESVLGGFHSAVAPLWEQTAILARQNARLARARDLLLPKLMSGQLDVSGIRLPEELAA